MRRTNSLFPNLPGSMKRGGMVEQTATRAMVARALAEDRVCVVFQPVVDARQLTRVAFSEALIRLRTTNDGLLAPGQFLPAVAGTDLAVQLDCAALRQTLVELQNTPSARISVNVGADSLCTNAWIDTLLAFTKKQPDVAFRLIVEMTEDASVMNHPNCPAFLNKLRAMGVSLAMDDFGAGATGFSQFRDNRFDIVKIDGSFGDGLNCDKDAQVLVSALVQIAKHFEMMTVIEYIDNPADAGRAMNLGIDCMQGFLFGRPELQLCSKVERPNNRLSGTG